MSLVDMQQQQQQPPTSKLVLAVSHLPFADYQRFVMHDIPAAIRLSRTCRVLYKKLRDHSSLWQHLYHDKFLSGLCAAKEWDFVCWYARTRLPIDDTSVGTTTSLDRLDWYEIYCHRVITEQNWRYNRSRRITIPWPTSEYQCDWELLETTLTTTVLATPVVTHDDINKRRSLGLNERRFLGLNERVYFPNDENTTTPIWFELSKCGLYKGISSLLGYEFAIIVIEGEESTVIDIYDRRHYRLQRTISLPPTFSNQSFVGNWIIFPTKKDYSKQQNSFPLFVYNIAKDIQFQKDYPMYINSACIYEATSDYAIIYTARLFEDRGRTGEWTLHQFHVDGTDKLLHKEQLNLPWVDYDLRVSYLDKDMIQMNYYVAKEYERCIHTIRLAEDKSVSFNRVQEAEHQVWSKGSIMSGYQRLLMEELGYLTLTDKADWSDVYQIDHIIGDLYLVYRDEDSDVRGFLEDMRDGTVIRELSPTYAGMHNRRALMIGFMTGNQTGQEAIIEYYGPN